MTAATARLGVTGTAAGLGAAGAALLFAPRELAAALGATGPDVVYQLLGATLLALGSMNYIARGSALGGIYGRAIVTADQVHFTIGAIALCKYALREPMPLPLERDRPRVRPRCGVLQCAALPRGAGRFACGTPLGERNAGFGQRESCSPPAGNPFQSCHSNAVAVDGIRAVAAAAWGVYH